ncbi:MAG TPA: hypothetical protein VGO57_12290 [Verrucomicrobiae bacterium]|jgi:hypothetical protein
MPDASSNPELLRSLGRLTRGLSALFWGLPAWLIASAEIARADVLTPTGIIPALVINLLLLYGLSQIGQFQKHERPWRNALDRAKLLGLVNLGLCPFLYWQNKMPREFFFNAAIFILILSALFFLFNLNLVLKQLGAMLPDETLRQETRQFTKLNRWLLMTWLVLVLAVTFLPQLTGLPSHINPKLMLWLQHASTTVLLSLGLSPLAITMALLWKAKEVIFDSVFGLRR